jgi:hypothetical protein
VGDRESFARGTCGALDDYQRPASTTGLEPQDEAVAFAGNGGFVEISEVSGELSDVHGRTPSSAPPHSFGDSLFAG